jgi:hypothetical protein
MKYKAEKIYEDEEILKGWGVNEAARTVGCSPAWISRLKNNKAIASQKFYTRLKNLLLTK